MDVGHAVHPDHAMALDTSRALRTHFQRDKIFDDIALIDMRTLS